MMKVVPIMYCDGGSKTYLCAVPDDQNLKGGETVLLDAKWGEAKGKCICDSFDLDESPLSYIKIMFGAEKLIPVIGKMVEERW